MNLRDRIGDPLNGITAFAIIIGLAVVLNAVLSDGVIARGAISAVTLYLAWQLRTRLVARGVRGRTLNLGIAVLVLVLAAPIVLDLL